MKFSVNVVNSFASKYCQLWNILPSSKKDVMSLREATSSSFLTLLWEAHVLGNPVAFTQSHITFFSHFILIKLTDNVTT